jgi:scyllo-inosamine-4-phosphate amidinotransferase 1
MKISSRNEWDPLRSVIVGSAEHANWPTTDPVFAQESQRTLWRDSPPPSGPVPQWIVEETQEDLQHLSDMLTQAGVAVYRPNPMDFVALDGMYNYCPRDRLLIAGSTVVDPAMMYPCRDQELTAYHDVVDRADHYVHMPRHEGMTLDAANISRLDDTWLFLESASGNRAAYDWLCTEFPDQRIELCNFYAGVHIDSTVAPLRSGTVMLNASRVTESNCPRAFDGWDKIWIEDCVPQAFYQYPYASRWIGMNTLSIDPDTVIVDAAQTHIIKTLEQRHFTVIPLTLRHSRTLGGGFHCVTLDLWRQHD